MGTNFYIETNRCSHCGRSDRLHIGKSSAGWCFSLHVYPDRGINTLDDWRPLLVSNPIQDEYDRTITFDRMIEIITQRSSDQTPGWTEDELRENGAIRGPNGLARAFGRGVMAGEGTWDYTPYEFS